MEVQAIWLSCFLGEDVEFSVVEIQITEFDSHNRSDAKSKVALEKEHSGRAFVLARGEEGVELLVGESSVESAIFWVARPLVAFVELFENRSAYFFEVCAAAA